MTYDALDQNGEGSAAECCSQPTPTPYFIARGSATLVTQVQSVRASSISIPGGGIRVGSTGRSYRGYCADHAQASAEHCGTAAEIRAKQWPNHWNDRDSGVELVSTHPKKTWLSGAPYGYRYIRKTDEAPAAYSVYEAEAHVVQRIYEMYTVQGFSIGGITRRLNAESIPTRKESARWERSTVWAVWRNPAYRGVACFGKTRVSTRSRVMRPQRRRGVTVPSVTVGHERPREEWIEIPVPALVSEESFARAQELLQENKIRSRRRTIEPSVVQGLVSCQKCGYAFSRTSTCTSARKIHYYKCIGSDSWRKLGGPVCDNRRLVRQDLLDQIVWAEVIRLLEDPTLIQQELDRRLAAARASDPTKKREQGLQRELIQVGKGIERLLTAYQEGLLSIEQLRQRMPSLRNREQMLRSELQAIIDQINDRAAFLRLAETLTAFLSRLRSNADTLDVAERQRIVRLVVKEVLVGENDITIRHSIPIPSGPPSNGRSTSAGDPSYLLCKGSGDGSLGCVFEW